MKLSVFLIFLTIPVYFLVFQSTKLAISEDVSSSDQEILLSAAPAPGVIFFSNDNGKSWQNKSTGLPPGIFLSDIAVSDKNLAISTKQHGIYIYDFKSNRWKETAGEPNTKKDIDALFFAGNRLFAGSQGDGIYVSTDDGISWKQQNIGLGNLTIRKFAELENQIFAGTNGGLYRLNETQESWEPIFGDDLLQVNGIIGFEHEIYIGTNKGVFKSPMGQNNWKQMYSELALHNISVANGVIYALAYNELMASKDKGQTWQSDQYGIPKKKYSFQLRENNGSEFVGQWDGIYTKDKYQNWKLLKTGIPENEAITEMNIFNGMLVASSSHWINYK